MLILGSLVVIALFAALIGPYFIDWNNYKATFEAEAEKIIGQPVHVTGTAEASLLPTPSVTFTGVQVGDREGRPMMTIEKFTATLDLMPLFGGQIHVAAMKLDRPRIAISVDDAGRLDWLIRSQTAKPVDPASVVLQDVEIADGTVTYSDAAGGVAREFDHVTARVDAGTLSGPWHLIGSYQEGGAAGQFQLESGRQAQDGSLRVRLNVTPPNAALTINTDGSVTNGDDGLAYAGTFNTAAVNTDDDTAGSAIGWRSEGSFALKRGRLAIDKGVVSFGSLDQPTSLAGSMIVDFGRTPHFEATLQARQLDLDRLFGSGPSQPVAVNAAADRLLDSLKTFAAPPMPGRLAFSVPTIVVGGGVAQDIRFDVDSADGGWQVSGFHARLPGDTSLEGDGLVSTGDHLGFGGTIRLDVARPTAFAAWWRGAPAQGTGGSGALPPFKLAGEAHIEANRIAVSAMTAEIGGATISGGFSWTDTPDHGRLLDTDLTADHLDLAQVRSVAELLAGQNLADTAALADSYTVKLTAGELAVEDLVARDVSVDAGFVNGTVTVKKIDVGDLGGAHVVATQGQITDIAGTPHGRLTAHVDATTLTGISHLVDRLMPRSGLARWLAAAAPSLVPLTLDADVAAPPKDGAADQVRLTLHGSADATNIDGLVDLVGTTAAWRDGMVTAHLGLSSFSGVGMVRQAGLAAVKSDATLIGSGKVTLDAQGMPAKGLATTVDGVLGGLAWHAGGTLALTDGKPPAFDGDFTLDASDLTPLITLVGLDRLAGGQAASVGAKGNVSAHDGAVTIAWNDAHLGERTFQGKTTFSTAEDGGWRADGNLSVDRVDLDWLAGLGLGASPLPTDDPSAPWSKTPFGGPLFGKVNAKLAIDADRMAFGNLEASKASFTLTLAPDRIAVDDARADFIDGRVTGGMAVRNVGGDVGLTGRFDLKDATLDRLAWQENGRPVATGTLALSADFEATGRSPAGLVATLTGGGAISLSQGLVRYINPQSGILVVRASDRGDQFNPATLTTAFTGYIDGGNLPFGDAGAAFSITAGTVSLKNMTLAAGATALVGGAVIDLSGLTLESDWTLTLDPGPEGGNAGSPQVGLVFKGPIDAPVRSIDVLQLASYLNIRQTERLEQMLTLEQNARLEHERFGRELRRLRSDDQQREEAAKADAAARAEALTVLDRVHDARETESPLSSSARSSAVIPPTISLRGAAGVLAPASQPPAVVAVPLPTLPPASPVAESTMPTGPLPPIPPPRPAQRRPVAPPPVPPPLVLVPPVN